MEELKQANKELSKESTELRLSHSPLLSRHNMLVEQRQGRRAQAHEEEATLETQVRNLCTCSATLLMAHAVPVNWPN